MSQVERQPSEKYLRGQYRFVTFSCDKLESFKNEKAEFILFPYSRQGVWVNFCQTWRPLLLFNRLQRLCTPLTQHIKLLPIRFAWNLFFFSPTPSVYCAFYLDFRGIKFPHLHFKIGERSKVPIVSFILLPRRVVSIKCLQLYNRRVKL